MIINSHRAFLLNFELFFLINLKLKWPFFNLIFEKRYKLSWGLRCNFRLIIFLRRFSYRLSVLNFQNLKTQVLKINCLKTKDKFWEHIRNQHILLVDTLENWKNRRPLLTAVHPYTHQVNQPFKYQPIHPYIHPSTHLAPLPLVSVGLSQAVHNGSQT